MDDITYDKDHRVAVCRRCETCLGATEAAWTGHLRREPHRLKGDRLKATVAMLGTFDLRTMEELRANRPRRSEPCRAIEGLRVFAGYVCKCVASGASACDQHCTRRLVKMREHAWSAHGIKAAVHDRGDRQLWSGCRLQTYFTAGGMIDYFVVVEEREEGGGEGQDEDYKTNEEEGDQQPRTPARKRLAAAKESLPTPEQSRLFSSLRKDAKQAALDLEVKAAVVQDLGQGRGDRERWLIYMGFPTHLRGLREDEVKSSFTLPKKTGILKGQTHSKQGNSGGSKELDEGDEWELKRILAAVDSLLRKAYNLVADRSLERKMTHQRAQQLSDFAAGSDKKGKDIAFRCFKHESTLVAYFRKMKELLVYFYRVVHRKDGHFTRDAEGQTLPEDVMNPTPGQLKAMEDMIAVVRRRAASGRAGGRGSGDDEQAEEVDDPELEHAVRQFYVRLICHTVGSSHFQSPVLSFCAMTSRTAAYNGREDNQSRRKARQKGNGDDDLDEAARRQSQIGGWQDPGNYSSGLSALVWTAQLLLFEAACHYERDDEDRIPARLGRLCEEYMHQKGETAFGHILQWRLYLTKVARSAINRRQARWSWDGTEITYLGTTLNIKKHVPQLLLEEYRRARNLLYDVLLFGARDIAPVEAWRLQDDLDAEDCGGSWMTDGRNTELLRDTNLALLEQIEQRADLRSVFLREKQAGQPGEQGTSDREADPRICEKAMAIYEASVQDFLKSICPLLHISPMPPTRAPEFLTITYANSGSRRRSMLIWERMLMIHIRYRKSQEQTGKDGDNVRFIPPAIAELVLTFLAVVQPLRLVFLRQVEPGGLLSPYLFSRLDGTVWGDEMVSKCLSQACSRSEVPEFKVSWWRQAAASITKEKFAPKERANFNLEEMETPEAIEEEDLIVDLAEASNHSYRTFNHAYAGSTTLTMSTLLHRAYRASHSWRTLFGVDELLAEEKARSGGKRPVTKTELDPLSTYKKVRLRTRPLQKEKGLEAAARELHNDSSLQLRRPGQRDAMLATMGPGAAEQVVVVLGTGSGKTLIIMVAAALEGAGTTIVVLPTVALRGNMLSRLTKAGLRAVVWAPGETRSGTLVLVSAEAACTKSFLEYAHGLESRQKLDRIVIDECHLTVTATYRQSMRVLGSFVRQIRTQTVWLTATLPPDLEPAFVEQNMLVRPRTVRESTNRANIRYTVHRYKGPGGLCRRAAELIRPLEVAIRQAGRGDDLIGGGKAARIIVYCQTIELMRELASEMNCSMYTGDQETMSAGDKDAAIQQWLGQTGSPVIMATSALGVGFDYPHVRWVVHAGAPRRLTDFSQESGRAGRDGRPAESIVLLNGAWVPCGNGRLPRDMDEEFMQLYLTQQHCSRAVLSQYLDARTDWKWCMAGEDEVCGVCPQLHTERRPPTLELGLQPSVADPDGSSGGERVMLGHGHEKAVQAAADMVYTGPDAVLHRQMLDGEMMNRFEADLATMRGCCLLCRIKGRPSFDHEASRCSHRSSWQRAKKKVIQSCNGKGGKWMADYTACFMCYLPQTICNRADPEANADANATQAGEAAAECQFADMVMPLCYGAFFASGPRESIHKHSRRRFRGEAEYMVWLGESTTFGGLKCTQAARLAAFLLAELG